MTRPRPLAPVAAPDYRLPKPRLKTLCNGLRLVSVERSETSFAEFRLVVESGFAADTADQSGLCGLAMEALVQGRLDNRRGRADRFIERLGGTLCARARPDAGVFAMSAFAANLDVSLQAFADTVARPGLDPEAFERIRSIRLGAIAKEKTSPLAFALRLAPALVYARDDPYAKPFTGSGTESGLERISPDSLHAYYRRGLRPGRATLVMVGPNSDALIASAEKAFGAWHAGATEAPGEESPRSSRAEEPGKIIVADCPGAAQCALFALFASVPRGDPAAEALIIADAILAGMFTSRLNMNLRETRGWTYGVCSMLADARRGGLWLVYSFVQRDRTGAAMREIEREIRGFANDRPPVPEEVSRAIAHVTLGMAAAFETGAGIATALEDAVSCRLPVDSYGGFAGRPPALGTESVVKAASEIINIVPVSWILVGDTMSIETEIQSYRISGPRIIVDRGSTE